MVTTEKHDPFQMQVLTDDEVETVEIEWVDDIPVVIDIAIDPQSPALVVVQKPSPQAKAKRTKRTKTKVAEAAAQPDLARALAILTK